MRRLAGRRAERVAIDRLVAATRSGRTGTLALERRQGLSAGALRGARALRRADAVADQHRWLRP